MGLNMAREAIAEPAIITYGRTCIEQEEIDEYKLMLWRAFGQKKADFIVLNSSIRGQRFTSAGAAWAIDQGWLYCDRSVDEGQSIVSSFRLTDKGKKALGLS